ncbi:MAG: sugar phosphate isomerase/epimerase family protein [Limisphaerales bacterium]
MKPAVTVSLVPEARGGPFIFWDDLSGACKKAAALGYAAIEVFPPAPGALDAEQLRGLLREHRLALATLGTGGGWIRQKLTLTSANPEVRARAVAFIKEMMDVAAPFGAAVILGSMQGRAEGDVSRSDALNYLGEALTRLADYAHAKKITLLYEHLNRYETNLLNRIEDVVPFIKPFNGRVKILADLFHLSIEEASIADAIRSAGDLIGHVHFADSNRRPAGMGHTDFDSIFAALREIGYMGYVSAEAFPYPDSDAAARQTIEEFRRLQKA